MPDPAHGGTRRRLGEVLVAEGVITHDQLTQALEMQGTVRPGERKRRLGAILSELGFASERQIAGALGTALGLEVIDLGVVSPSPEAARLVPRAVVERHVLLPIRRTESGGLVVACADPTNVVGIDDVRLYTGITDVSVVVATETQVRDQIARTWSLSEGSADVAGMLDELAIEPAGAVEDDDEAGASVDSAPTVRLVNVVLADAVRARASDIHIEPQAGHVRIRYRVDGLLRDVMTVPKAAAPGLVSRIKVMSSLDIAERRIPQDGRVRLSVDRSTIDARVSTLPNVHGEKVVIRLLARADDIPALAKLGMDEKQLEVLIGSLTAPQGLVLITGPTGSGKTNTLYAAMAQIKTPDRNIVTLEDPVEIQMQGITQVQVSEKSGLTFARGLRSILRQDPDIVLVGEVRDPETAKLALEASLTGHLVLTTLHTNSAPAALTRLVDMGVEPFLVASSLSLVVAQRLVRRVCESCAAPYIPSPRTQALLGMSEADFARYTPKRGRGCADCGGTGYRGRIGVYEVLPVTARLRSVLMSNPTEGAVADAARSAGMVTLRGSALAQAHAGVTTYEEVLRATHVDGESGAHCTTCERGLAEDMVVCPWCGTPVDRGHCSGCSRPLDPNWKVCPWCRLPTEKAMAPELPEPPVEQTAKALPRLLLVDDDESVRAYVATTLLDSVEVDAVGTATEGLDRAASGEYDGVLVDNVLPDLTGVEMIRLLRSEPSTALLPLMLFTGYDDVEMAAREAGSDDYLAKPIEPAVLEERVLALVQRSPRLAHT